MKVMYHTTGECYVNIKLEGLHNRRALCGHIELEGLYNRRVL